MKLIIHAPNVHQGGGAALLLPLLSSIEADCQSAAIIDRRLQVPDDLQAQIEVIRVEPSLRARVEAERKLTRLAGPEDIVLCFGNLPPLFRFPAKTFVFVQNRLLLESVSLSAFSWNVRMRLSLERRWLQFRAAGVSRFVVQTPSMQRLLEMKLGVKAILFPFTRERNGNYLRALAMTEWKKPAQFDFLYVASGEPHKNHRNLILAWQLLAKEHLQPSLQLTVNRSSENAKELMIWIEAEKNRGDLRINNADFSSQSEIDALYGSASALIYPSRCESLGLPLIEARNAGLPIMASELDYVRDVVDPEQSFDPESPVSIARAVKRFLGTEEQPLPLKNAGDFIQCLLKQDP